KEGEKILGVSRNNGGHHARLLHLLGCVEAEHGDLDRALELCRKAQKKLEQALGPTPSNRALRSDRLTNREAVARYDFLRGKFPRDRWIAEQERILQERKALVGEGASPRLQGGVAATAAVLAGLLLEAGRPAEALACVEGVLPAHEKLVR